MRIRRFTFGHVRLLVALAAVPATPPMAAAQAVKIFDGQKKILINTHDSVNPSTKLGDHVKRYLRELGYNENLIFLSAPSGRMSGVDTKGAELAVLASGGQETWLAGAANTIAGARAQAGCADCPVIFIAYASPYRFIADSTNAQQVAAAVEEWKFMCDKVKEAGADVVIPSTIHHNFSHRRLADNEPAMVREFNRRNYGYHGVDMVTPSYADFPYAVIGDGRHNTTYGLEMYGHEWFKALCEHDGRAVPAWSEEAMLAEREKAVAQTARLTILEPRSGWFRLGDQITIKWESDCGSGLEGLSIQMQFRRLDGAPDSEKEWQLPVHSIGYLVPGDQAFTATWRGQGGSVECTKKQYTFTLTESLFKVGGVGLTMPTPVYFQISHPNDHPSIYYPFNTTVVDWENPRNMIVVDPTGTADPSGPIYPEGWGGAASVSRRTFRQAPGTAAVIPGVRPGPQTRVTVCDLRGRTLYARSVAHLPSLSLPRGGSVRIVSVDRGCDRGAGGRAVAK